MKTSNRQEQKEQTKRLIIRSAYEVFSEIGIINTRMSDIAGRAGVSHGTLFAHFENQEALLTEVIEEYGRKIAMRTHELADSCSSLQELLSAHLAGISEFEPFYTRLVIENRMLNKEARVEWVTIQSAVALHFGEVIEREKSESNFAEVPIYMLFNMWLGLVHYYLENGDIFAPEGNIVKRYSDIIIESYIKLIKK